MFLFCNIPRRHTHSLNARSRLYDVGIRVVDRFTYQHDNAHDQVAKFAIFFSQQNNVTCLDHLIWFHLNTYGIGFVIVCIYEYQNTKLLRKKFKAFLQY